MRVMDHAMVTDWDTMIEQLKAGIVPYLNKGTRDPVRSLFWMLIGFNTQAQDYPANTQLFTQSEGSKFFAINDCREAAKCRLCLQAVPINCKKQITKLSLKFIF